MTETTEIKVVLDTGQLTDIGALTQEERSLIFDQLSTDNPDIPRVIIDSFAEMQDEIAHASIRFIKPDLKELLLRKIITIQLENANEFGSVVIPIITNIGIPNEITYLDKQIHGAALPRFNKTSPKINKDTVAGSIRVRFDTNISAITESGLDYIAPPNEELVVVGIAFSTICRNNHLIRSDSPPMEDRLIMGNYNYVDLARSCEPYFIHPDYSISSFTQGDSSKVMFAELEDSKVMQILTVIFTYLQNIDSYYHSLAAAEAIYAQLDVINTPSVLANPSLKKLFDELNVEHKLQTVCGDESTARPEILDVLESVHNGRFNTRWYESVLSDIYTRGFSTIYNRALLKGKDDKDVVNGIALYKERKDQVQFRDNIKNRLLDERNKLNTYRAIIEKKFGVKRLAEIEHQILLKPRIITRAKDVLSLLRPEERKPVELEFERREKYLEAYINNKCPHIKVYKKFRHAQNDELAQRLYSELKGFFKDPYGHMGGKNRGDSMIMCNVCGFELICPHYREFVELSFARQPYSEIKAKLTKYIDHAVVKGQYYCKICGEMISSLEAFDTDSGESSNLVSMDEELKNFMWGEIAILTKYLKFGNLVDVPKLITAARDACYPYIFEIEKQILKSKTNSADEIKAKKRLYITIYAFAYFIHLVLANKGRAGENDISFKNFSGGNQKSLIVDMIRHSLTVIMSTRNIVIREIPSMSVDIIKNTLIEAFKSMQNVGATVIVYSGEAEDLLTTLMMDPVFGYFYTINVIDDVINGRKPPKLHESAKESAKVSAKSNKVDRIDEVMGEPIAKLEKTKGDIFAKAIVPKFDGKWHVKQFMELISDEQSKTNKLSSYMKNKGRFDPVATLNELYTGYIGKSFELFHDKLKKHLYTEPLYIDVGTKADPLAPMDVKFRTPHEKYREEYLKVQSREIELFKYRQLLGSQNFMFLPVKKTRQWVDPHAKLGRIYDTDGNPHNWKIYVVAKGAEGAKVDELTSNDIAKSTEAGNVFNGTIIDRKCSVCGVLWSEAANLPEEQIRAALSAKREVSNFFRFYENRCPKGNLHEFDDSGNCSKCGMVVSFPIENTSSEALAYYHEFTDIYLQERSEFIAAEDSEVTSVVGKPPQDLSKYAEEMSKWVPNFNVILDLSNKLKVSQRVISALGATEKIDYIDVQSGAYEPVEIDERNATRIFVVNSYIKNLITEYNQIRYYYRLIKPTIDLSSLIDASGINKHKIPELVKKLPEIFDDYNNKFLYMQRNKKPRETIAFCIQNFCEMCLGIWNDTDKETEKLRRDFVTYFVKKTLRAEELLSKPGYFNWSLLCGDKEMKGTESYDTNTRQDTDGEKEYVDEVEETEGKEDGDFGDSNAPLNTDDLDIDRADDDPMDDEDESNGIRVGEELGLT